MKANTKDFFEFYRFDNNRDLILKLCKKFRLNEPILRANYYGDVDVIFREKLKVYCVRVLEDSVILESRNDKNFGYKTNKEYMSIKKRYIDGNIWYNVIKKISKDSEI